MAEPPLLAGAAAQFAAFGLALAAAVQGLGWRGQTLAFGLYGAVCAMALCGLGAHAPHRRFGAANAVTVARAAAAALLVGVAGEATLLDAVPGPGLRWTLVGVATGALLLDGADGWLARRFGFTSRFGARFDMETDALFVAALALLVYAAHQAAAFVLLSGVLRYLFVAAGHVVPALTAPLPPSQRRRVVCVTQSLCLIAALVPSVPPFWAQGLCAAGLALLVYSFAADAAWALSRARRSHIMRQHAATDARS